MASLTPTARRRADRERQRRRRQRVRAHKIVAPVELGCDELDLLVKLHWLADRDADNPQRVASAILRALADAAKAE